jgi:DnaK suppressor protein
MTEIQSAHDDLGKCQTILEGGIPYLDRESKQLRNARAALRRLREGSFGVCEHREEPIHPQWRLALPWAAFCLPCQEVLDRQVVPAATDDLAGHAA